MTHQYKKLSHSVYECKYHIVFCPKYRYRVLKGEIAEYTVTIGNSIPTPIMKQWLIAGKTPEEMREKYAESVINCPI